MHRLKFLFGGLISTFDIVDMVSWGERARLYVVGLSRFRLAPESFSWRPQVSSRRWPHLHLYCTGWMTSLLQLSGQLGDITPW